LPLDSSLSDAVHYAGLLKDGWINMKKRDPVSQYVRYGMGSCNIGVTKGGVQLIFPDRKSNF
jgi:hypothetical protein